jgi:hypothetical protein
MEAGQNVKCSELNPFRSIAGEAVGVITCVSVIEGKEFAGVLFESLGVEQGQIDAENYEVVVLND